MAILGILPDSNQLLKMVQRTWSRCGVVGSFKNAGGRPLKATCGLIWVLAFLISSILMLSFMFWMLIFVFFVMFSSSVSFCSGWKLIFLGRVWFFFFRLYFVFDLFGGLQLSLNILFSRSALHLLELIRFLFLVTSVGIVGLSFLFIRFSELKRLFWIIFEISFACFIFVFF